MIFYDRRGLHKICAPESARGSCASLRSVTRRVWCGCSELGRPNCASWKSPGNQGLPPKLAGMASALSALPNDRMRNLAWYCMSICRGSMTISHCTLMVRRTSNSFLKKHIAKRAAADGVLYSLANYQI